MEARFVKGEMEFYSMLGLNYGHIETEDYKPVMVTSLQQGKRLLKEAVKQNIVSSDKAQEIEISMSQFGLAEDMAAIFKAVQAYQMPDCSKPEYSFVVCRCGAPIKHGYITHISNQTVARISTMSDGLKTCHGACQQGIVSGPTAISVLKDMIKAGLPADDDEQREQYMALSEETREKWESKIKDSVFSSILVVIDLCPFDGADKTTN